MDHKDQGAGRVIPELSPMTKETRSTPTLEPVVTPKKFEAPTKEQQRAASTIFKNFRLSKVRHAKAEIQEAMKGNLTGTLLESVGKFHESAGLVAATTTPISKDAGRLTDSWSGKVSSQKAALEAQRTRDPTSTLDPIGTTHHLVSDHFLGFVDEGVTRVGVKGGSGKKASDAFRQQVKKSALYDGPSDSSALFQMRQNLTYGPLTDNIHKDPGVGFDPNFEALAQPKGGITRDWDKRSKQMRPVHNMGLLLKSGKYEMTPAGVDHMTTRLASAEATHDAAMHGRTYQAEITVQESRPNPAFKGKKLTPGVPRTLVSNVKQMETRDLTIPVHGVKSGHFSEIDVPGKVKGTTVKRFEKKKWK